MTYLSPEELRISPAEHAGLIKVAAYLRGIVEHIPGDAFGVRYPIHDDAPPSVKLGFNMGYAVRPIDIHESKAEAYHCGSVACIGGHLSLLLSGIDIDSHDAITLTKRQIDDTNEYVFAFEAVGRGRRSSEPMANLFFPWDAAGGVAGKWDRIRPTDAAHAIEAFLTTGTPDWSTVPPEPS